MAKELCTMIRVELNVNKANVYNEVAKTTSYTGDKMTGDEGAYERIFTKDDDRLALERFWVEAANAVTDLLKQYIVEVSSQPESHCLELDRNYEVKLDLSNSFDVNLTGSMETSLFSFFVMYIVAKWYKYTNKEEAESYAAESAAMLDDVTSKLYYRKKPTRIIPNT